MKGVGDAQAFNNWVGKAVQVLTLLDNLNDFGVALGCPGFTPRAKTPVAAGPSLLQTEVALAAAILAAGMSSDFKTDAMDEYIESAEEFCKMFPNDPNYETMKAKLEGLGAVIERQGGTPPPIPPGPTSGP